MSLRGRKFLITAGPTRAPMDAIRYITNKSTGRLGALLAEEALRRGASVTFVHGRPSVVPTVRGWVHDHLTLIAIDTVHDLIRTFRQELPRGYDAVIHNMAVLDFEPAELRPGKTGSGESEWVIRLVPTPKAVNLVKELAPQTFLVAFKLEVGRPRNELIASALDLLRKSRCDLVVANDQKEIEAGEHTGYVVDPSGEVLAVAQGKEAIARTLIRLVEERLNRRPPGG
ncbi:MAG: phosphopantothenoylcysteine decarboxylase [Armatimonadota bacterium]|nr:phosphopantothenoylcysteine decarboxylase [Armatimonadota bacterium]MDR7464961.1 phosphopantothenoylcysteine decarboxylase [Armatimonadota bacterium]MDR7470046.1 phosphopantothenoylcysteine decarboxylase [Armatimonadota bacterium]MDR7474432.1 phosphopantothenoylcysteine decarboxylase [Armatimonadota bacterium]MDR7538260.1 phosphopantothenoylcysteine decarboxylase [Armatimonadota bacterium]